MTGPEIKQYRQRRGLTQGAYWGKIGVTQSGASRYEQGRRIPRAVQALLYLAYGPKNKADKLYDELRRR